MRKWKDEERNQSGQGFNTAIKKLALLVPVGLMATYLSLYALDWYFAAPSIVP